MATIGHLAAGLAIARGAGSAPSRLRIAVVTAAAVLPDVDLLLGINHRGPTHSFGFAAIVGGVTFIVLRALRASSPARGAILAAAAVISHIGLDLLTAHSPLAALWPLSLREFVLTAPPLPAAPTDEDLFTARGAGMALAELAWSIVLVAAAWWPGLAGRARRA